MSLQVGDVRKIFSSTDIHSIVTPLPLVDSQATQSAAKSVFEEGLLQKILQEKASPEEMEGLRAAIKPLGKEIDDRELSLLAQFKKYTQKNGENDPLLRDGTKICAGKIAGISRNILITNKTATYHFNKGRLNDKKHLNSSRNVGFGVDLMTNKLHAIKSMRHNETVDRHHACDYKAEFEIQSQYNNSDHIVHVVGLVVAEGKKPPTREGENSLKSYLITEMANGGDLYDAIYDTKNPLTRTNMRHIAFQILESVEEIHRKGHIHGDLKPANMLIHYQQGGDAKILITDFGHACAIGSEECKFLRGTPPYYLSPQGWHARVWDGEQSSQANDIWAVGIILYELFYKTCPQFHLIHTFTSGSKVQIKDFLTSSLRLGYRISHLPANDEKTRKCLTSNPSNIDKIICKYWGSLEGYSIKEGKLLRAMLHPDTNKRIGIVQARECMEGVLKEFSI
jgi:serine/threonine protein kinase